MTTSTQVMQAWKDGNNLKTKTVTSSYGLLKSYEMIIGNRFYGVTFLLNPDLVSNSQTTKKHLNKARSYADVLIEPINGQFPTNEELRKNVPFLQALLERINPIEYPSAIKNLERLLREIDMGYTAKPIKNLYPQIFSDLGEDWIVSFSDVTFKTIVQLSGIYVARKSRGVAYKLSDQGEILSVYVGKSNRNLSMDTPIEKVK